MKRLNYHHENHWVHIAMCKDSVIKMRAIALLLFNQEVKLGNAWHHCQPKAKDKDTTQCSRIQTHKSWNSKFPIASVHLSLLRKKKCGRNIVSMQYIQEKRSNSSDRDRGVEGFVFSIMLEIEVVEPYSVLMTSE